MKCGAILLVLTSLSGASLGRASGQVSQLPFDERQQLGPVLHRAIRVSQILQNQPTTGLVGTSTISGDLAYTTGNVRHPFYVSYSGGGMFTVNSPLGNTVYQNLQLSQGFSRRDWDLTLINTFSYLPESPTAGAVGIPGVGDLTGSGLGSLPPGIAPNQSILANNASRISNAIYSEFERRLDFNTSLSGSGAFGVLNFPSGKGINSQQESASGAINYRLNSLNIIAAGYQYARYEFTASGFSFQSPGVSVGYKRQWSRTLLSQVSFGPQWVLSSDTTQVPNRTRLAAGAELSWERGDNSASLGYSRGASGGSGALGGAEVDNVQGAFGRTVSRVWTVALTASFARTVGLQTGSSAPASGSNSPNSIILPPQSTIVGLYGGFQVTRRVSRNISAYLSYTAQHQSVSYPGQVQSTANGTPANILNGLSNIVGFGFGFTPPDKRLWR
jgi:Surface lipoprotein assembly modifier